MAGTVHHHLVLGGVMKLGKAIAAGVAEEQPVAHEEELELPAGIEDVAESVPEEAPTAR
ncbi:hypothetical protein [Streptomyces chromofuscus]|uniref:Uncharacterized protein n=1 Tax=Streptomyces chromofuscus TaxID=42881 RepID=A0A7M2TIZ2_STRCW|nr:hypothetical protein [Streptomyces chromofuscus]QOV47913.1 hypothetical protein IPT68_08800 [Streptomyces chromofuscus]GGT11877.1 hypothetical protein GCM10010254_35660 [Streptomyces chromofuscus]